MKTFIYECNLGLLFNVTSFLTTNNYKLVILHSIVMNSFREICCKIFLTAAILKRDTFSRFIAVFQSRTFIYLIKLCSNFNNNSASCN